MKRINLTLPAKTTASKAYPSKDLSIKIKDYKRVKPVTEESITELFNKPQHVDYLTSYDIGLIGSYFTVSPSMTKWMSSDKIDHNLKHAIEALRSYNPDKLLHVLNSLSAERNYYAVVIGKLSERLELPNFPTNKQFDLNLVRIYMAAQVLSTMIDLKYINLTEKLEYITDEDTGRGEWKTQQFLSFGNTTKSNPMNISGISMTPGKVTQKEYKVQAGGKSRKLNKVEKELLALASSFKLRLVTIPLDILETYIKMSPWYLDVMAGRVQMDKIQADELVYESLEKYSRISSLDGFYLSMWMDYRTRLYYDFTELGMNPHGKHFETSLYESAEPYTITNIDEYLYSAAVIIDGRMPHHEAINKFNTNKDHYMSELRRPLSDTPSVDELGEFLYNTRLADAIDSYYNGTETHFLLSED